MTDIVDNLTECQHVIGHTFANVGHLTTALVHASASTTRLESNERQEFLGDAIFGAIICDELYHRHPEKAEGELTKIKSALVSRAACARATKAMGLGQYVVLGKGVASRSGTIPSSILAAVFEAIVAAVYLDAGYEAARAFILHAFRDELAVAAHEGVAENYKSQLQQRSQKIFGTTPNYGLIDEKGPDHSKSFQVCATIDGREFEAAWGPNKKQAEQKAAENALRELDRDAESGDISVSH